MTTLSDLDVRRLRAQTPGCAAVLHLNNAGASLPTQRTLAAMVEHLQLEARIGGYEAAAEAAERIGAFYPLTAGLIVFGAIAISVEDVVWFWIAGAFLGIFVGPAQAASRSLMARIAPVEMRAEMFGLYALSGKASAFLGPFVLGTVTYWTASQRLGMATILAFFAVGGILLALMRHPNLRRT